MCAQGTEPFIALSLKGRKLKYTPEHCYICAREKTQWGDDHQDLLQKVVSFMLHMPHHIGKK